MPGRRIEDMEAATADSLRLDADDASFRRRMPGEQRQVERFHHLVELLDLPGLSSDHHAPRLP
jgi:hypothetical protein